MFKDIEKGSEMGGVRKRFGKCHTQPTSPQVTRSRTAFKQPRPGSATSQLCVLGQVTYCHL